MNDDEKTFQCPVCVKGKYKENSLIQHLIDKHPDYPASKKIRNDYQFPFTCPLCSQKITTPVALMTHYNVYHPHEFQSLKILLGFDFFNPESTFESSEAIQIIPNLDPVHVYILPDNDQFYSKFHPLVANSPVMHSTLKSSNIFVLCCNAGIILMDIMTKGLGEYFRHYLIGKAPIIEFNTPNESKVLSGYGIEMKTNVMTDPFICQNYTQFVRAYGPPVSTNEDKQIDINKSISKIDLRLALINIAIAYHYLKTIGFFPPSDNKSQTASQTQTKSVLKCPCCEVTASNKISLYRHLFRQHPFPAMIMNQYKMADQPKGKFICEACHEDNLNSFDDLSIHVYNQHLKQLLDKTLRYIHGHKDIQRQLPDLEPFIQSEYKTVC